MRWRNPRIAGRGCSANVPDSEGGKVPAIHVGLADGFLQVAEILPYTYMSLQNRRLVLPSSLINRKPEIPAEIQQQTVHHSNFLPFQFQFSCRTCVQK